MKKSIILILLAVFSLNGQGNKFYCFVKARYLMDNLTSGSFNYNDYSAFIKIKGIEKINFGYNNKVKWLILLNHYYRIGKNDTLISYFKQAINEGFRIDDIPVKIKVSPQLANMYKNERQIFLSKINWETNNQFVAIQDSDQLYRAGGINTKEQDWHLQEKIDSISNYKLKCLTKLAGWQWFYKYDTTGNDDIGPNDLQSIIGHFNTSEVEYYRDTAISLAENNAISWDEAVMIEQYLNWKHPAFADLVYGMILEFFPLKKTILNKNGIVNLDSSFFELFTLGHVTLGGMPDLKIIIFPTQKHKKVFPNTIEANVKTIKEFLITIGVNGDNIIISSKVLCNNLALNDAMFSFCFEYGGKAFGYVNWYPPYRLHIFKSH